jgi:hypothetical protein
MLFVACGGCRNPSPLYCSSGVLLHGPVLAVQGPMGAQCPHCGPMLPRFVCGFCGLQQMVFFPSMPLTLSPQWMVGQIPNLAPAVQAPPGIDTSQLNALITNSVKGFLDSADSEVSHDFGDALGSWLQDDWQNRLQSQW